MRAPAIQLYYRDWMSHPGLRMCSIAARGLFADMMCIMAEGTPYGYLMVGGKDILTPTLARRVGESLQDVERWLAELLDHEVCQRDADGHVWSPRMVESERVRQARAAGGVDSQNNPNVPRKKEKGKDGEKDIHKVPTKDSFRPSPAVAVASATKSTSSTSARVRERLADEGDRTAFDVLLSRVPEPTTWAAECEAMLDGMTGHTKTTPLLLGRAIRDLTGNGKLKAANLRQFRRYVRDAGDDEAPLRNGSHKSVAEQGYANAKLAIQDL